MLNFIKLVRQCFEFFFCALIVGVLIAGCGSGSSSTATTPVAGFTQSYTSSAGAGDVLNFTVNTASMTYSFQVLETSYGASAVASGIPSASEVLTTETSTGTLTGPNAVGSYTASASGDGFIIGGEIFPLQNSFFIGHVIISKIGGSTRKIPVMGVTNPVTSLTGLSGEYNLQGFGCSGRSGGLVTGGTVSCANHYGTAWITPAVGGATATITTCRFGNLASSSVPSTTCVPLGGGAAVASITADANLTAVSGVPGVYDFKTASDGRHRGWLFAFTSAGQNVAIIDHDDVYTPEFGHSVALTQASVTSGSLDGNYFVKNNIGERHLMAVSGVTYTDISDATGLSASGSLNYDYPWTGLISYQFNSGAASGVMDIATVGAFSYTSNTYRYIFGVGLKY
jgi:hypothetical protein